MITHEARRRFLQSAAGVVLRPRTGLAALTAGSLVFVSPPASAFPWTVALSAASTLSGLMASSQGGNGGISATLEAGLEYMRVMSGQLTSIQTGLASLMSAVNQLEQKFRQALQVERAIELHHDVGAQIKNYRNEFERYAKGGFPTFSDWQNDLSTVSNLQKIDFSLNTAVNTVDEYQLYGPLTALQLPTALFCAMAVRVGLKDRNEALAARANQYLARFDARGDESSPNSTAAQMTAALANLAEATKTLQTLNVTIPQESDMARKAVLDLAVAAECHGYETQPTGDCTANCTTSQVSTLTFSAHSDIYRDAAAGIDQAGGLIRPLALSDGQPVIKDRTFTTKRDPKPFPNFPKAYVTAQKSDFGMSCPVDDATYRKAAEGYMANDLAKLQTIRAAVDQYNICLGQVALCASALASLLVARQAIIKSFSRPV